MPKMLTNTRSWAALDFIKEIGEVVSFPEETLETYRTGRGMIEVLLSFWGELLNLGGCVSIWQRKWVEVVKIVPCLHTSIVASIDKLKYYYILPNLFIPQTKVH